MRFFIALWRFLFGVETAQENQPHPDSQQNQLSRPVSPSPASVPQSLGQMEKQVAAMVQIPLSSRAVKAQFSSIADDGSTGVISESDMITPNGIQAEKIHHLLITGSGHVTKPSGIRVKCAFCGQFDSTLHRCSEPTCRLPLCELHAIAVEVCGEKICYCPAHAVGAEENRDNWKEYWFLRDRKKYAPDGK